MGVKPWESFTNQQQWREYLQNLIRTNDRALVKSILVIYERQTDDEKYSGQTTEHNGKGFGKIDSEFFSQIVVQLKHGYPLTDRQIAVARNKMPKYWRQLMQVSKAKMERERERSRDNA